MKLKNVLNIILYTFIIVVSLVPVKAKIGFIPIASDTVLGGLIILLGLIYILSSYKKDKKILDVLRGREIKFLGGCIVIFTVLSLASILYAHNKTIVISESIRFIEYVLIFYIVLIAVDNKTIKNMFGILYVTMIVASLFGLSQFIFNLSSFYDPGFMGSIGRGRIYSTFENPNYWGAAVNLVIFYPLICFIENKGKRLYNALAFLLFFSNLFLSGTRGSWVGFGVGLLLIAIIRYRKMLLAIPVLIAVALMTPMARNRFMSIFDINNYTNSERLTLWKTGWKMFEEHRLLGVGNGNYLYRYSEYVSKYPELYLQRNMYSVHNSYIKMFAELGFIGGTMFILVYLSLAYISFKIYKLCSEYKLIVLSFIGFLGAYFFQNFFNNLMFIPQLNVLVWIVIAILYKGYYIEKKRGVSYYE